MQEQFIIDTEVPMARGMYSVQKMALSKERDRELADLTTRTNNNLRAALKASNAGVREAYLTTINEDIDVARDNGYIESDVDVAKLKKSIAQDYAMGNLLQMSSSQRLSALRSGQFSQYMSPVAEVRMLNEARRQVVSDSERYERREAATLKLAQENNENQMMIGLADGEITDEGMLTRALAQNDISGPGYRRLRKMMREDPGIDHTETVMTLDAMAMEADPRFPDVLAQAMEDGEVTGSTAQVLARRHQSEKEAGGLANDHDVKEALAHIQMSLTGTAGLLAKLDTDEGRRMSQAKHTFMEELRAKRKQDLEYPAWNLAEEVVERYEINPPALSSFDDPRYRVGPRGKPDLAETLSITNERIMDGTLSAEEGARELDLLEKMFDAERRLEER